MLQGTPVVGKPGDESHLGSTLSVSSSIASGRWRRMRRGRGSRTEGLATLQSELREMLLDQAFDCGRRDV